MEANGNDFYETTIQEPAKFVVALAQRMTGTAAIQRSPPEGTEGICNGVLSRSSSKACPTFGSPSFLRSYEANMRLLGITRVTSSRLIQISLTLISNLSHGVLDFIAITRVNSRTVIPDPICLSYSDIEKDLGVFRGDITSRLPSDRPLSPVMSDYPIPLIVSAACGLTYLAYRLKNAGKREAGLPPGPPTSPIVGNLFQFPRSTIHLKFTEWAREYGDIVSVKLGGGTTIILSSSSAVREILDVKSANTSDRPQIYLINLMNGGKSFAFSRYGDGWKASRRAAHEILTPQACRTHLPIQQAEATQLMFELLTSPENFYQHIQRYSSSVIMSVLFSQRTPRPETPEYVRLWRYLHLMVRVVTPGKHPPLDLITLLQWIPEPFASWKKEAGAVRQMERELFFDLLGEVERRMADGTSNGCWMETIVARAEEFGLDREAIAYIGAILVEGGNETTASFLKTFVLAMTAHPEVQKKAQEEIDAVIGRERAPCLDDAEKLPYCNAIIQEVHRWRPVAPYGVYHATTAEVTYRGYRIPKGATIFQNTWGIFHDPAVYDNPGIFMPERFLANQFGLRDPTPTQMKEWRATYIFGAGRRICPGMHLATNSIRINVVNLLWAFEFLKTVDPETGNTIEPDVWDFNGDLATAPRPFKCRIKPRSEHHARLIRKEFSKATGAFEGFERHLSTEDKAFVEKQRAELRASLEH